ncbi:MAG: sigma-70 family RNA polymerase sigma factor [Ilumatobacteraceae bacterium]
MRAAQRGDHQALERLLHRHYDRIYAVCRRITGQDADAADAAQEAMIAIVRNVAKFDGRASFGTWTYRIATNASLDELRRRRRRPVSTVPTDEHAAEPVDHTTTQRLDAIGEREVLDAALAGLAEEFRVPVVLRDVGDLDYAEIAQVLDVPIGTVKSRIARGRAALATILGGNRGGAADRPSERP